MLEKWKLIVCNVGELVLFTQHNLLKLLHISILFLYHWAVYHTMYTYIVCMWYICGTYMYHSLSVHPTERFFWLFQLGLLWIKLLWTLMYRFLCEHKFPFFLGQTPKSTTAWLHSNCMFSFTRKLPSCFPEWLHHFYQQCMSDSVSLHLMSFLILVFLIGIQWHLIVILMCIYSG